MIELLVVVAIIALLVAILLPSLKSAREQARAAVCASNLHQLGIGFHTYASEHREKLPPYGGATSFFSYHAEPLWTQIIMPYMGHVEGDAESLHFGYNGPDSSKIFMPCPSNQPAEASEIGLSRPAPIGGSARTPLNYGISYPTIINYQGPPSTNVDCSRQGCFNGGARLEKIDPWVFMAGDAKSDCGTYRCSGGTCSEISNPLIQGQWLLTVDWDNDGQNDSWVNVYLTCTPYNGFNPVHNRSGNLLFTDGAVQRYTTNAFGQQGDDWWAKDTIFGLGQAVPNPYH